MRILVSIASLMLSGVAFADAGDYVGTWNVNLKASYSTCGIAKVGDEKAETWNVNAEGGGLKVVATGSEVAGAYRGKIEDDGSIDLHVDEKAGKGNSKVAADVGQQLKGTGSKLSGRAIVAIAAASHHAFGSTSASACAVVYEVTAKKQK